MKLTYAELEATDNSTGSFLARSAKGAKDAACSIYRDYKDWYHSNIDLPSVGGQMLEDFLTSLCPLEPPYSPPPLPPSNTFEGGQCCASYYDVYGFISFPNYPNSNTEQLIGSDLLGKINGIVTSIDGNGISTLFQLKYTRCDGISVLKDLLSSAEPEANARISRVVPKYGSLDNCGNPDSTPAPPVLAPPPIIDTDIIINVDGIPITIPFSFNPQISLPGLSINGSFNIFKPEFNFSLAPQFDVKPNFNLDVNPKINLNFDLDGVNINVGGSPDNDTVNNNNVNNNINNINNNVNNVNNNVNNVTNTVNNIKNNTEKTNDDVTTIKDKLACNPCDILEEIKEKLDPKSTFRSNSISEFQSVTRDNISNLSFIEIDLTVQPTKSKIIFGGNAPNVMFAGWLTWRKNNYNFAREQVTAEKSIYLAPKGANGFSICCTHNSRASCLYYIEIKE